MSFQAMAWATEQEVPAMQKIVLLMLANRTNHDTGQCTPSHERLAKDCGMSVRACKDQIVKLASAGLLEVLKRSKEGVSLPNQYVLAMHKGRGQELPTRGQQMPGGGAGAAWGVGQEVPTNQESETVNEPVSLYIAPKPSKKYSPMVDLLAAGVDEQIAADWLEVRKAKKAAPIKTQIEGVIKKLAAAGYSANDGITLCVEKGWARFDSEWLANSQQKQNQPQRQQSAWAQKQEREQAFIDRIQGKPNENRIVDIN